MPNFLQFSLNLSQINKSSKPNEKDKYPEKKIFLKTIDSRYKTGRNKAQGENEISGDEGHCAC